MISRDLKIPQGKVHKLNRLGGSNCTKNYCTGQLLLKVSLKLGGILFLQHSVVVFADCAGTIVV